jgi:Fur family ferric uptake transcriptional regulator
MVNERRGGGAGVEGWLAAEAIAELHEHGLRLTPQRLMILELLERSSGHVAPEDIYQQVHERFPMINRSTVYRTLETLEELGIVRHGHVEDGAARYHLARESHHLHLTCHRCGKAVEVGELTFAEPFLQSVKDRFGFEADLTHFPISGMCAECLRAAGQA